MRKQAATAKDGRVQQANFDTYQMLRMNEAPDHHRSEFRAAGRNGRAQSSEDRKTLLYMATTWESVADDRERTCPQNKTDID